MPLLYALQARTYIAVMIPIREIFKTETRTTNIEDSQYAAGARVVTSRRLRVLPDELRVGCLVPEQIEQTHPQSEADVIRALEDGAKYTFLGYDVWHRAGRLTFKQGNDEHDVPFPPSLA